MRQTILSAAAFAAWFQISSAVYGNGPLVKAIEVGADNVQALPGGREADGIIGDFVLVNDQIKAVVSGNLHERKANMFTHFNSPTPGCIYDLAAVGSENDQLTLFAPGGQQGQLSSVRVVEDGSTGTARVRAELTPAAGGGLGKTHDYILRPGWRYVMVVSTYRNASVKPLKIKPAPTWKGLESILSAGGVEAGVCPDPADRVGYAFAPLEWQGARPAKGEIEIAPGQEARFAAALAVGNGTADAYGSLGCLHKESFRFSGRVLDPTGRPAPQAQILFPLPGTRRLLTAFAGQDGGFEITLPGPSYRATVRDLGRPEIEAELKPDRQNVIEIPVAAAVEVRVRDEAGRPLPCKVQFFGEKQVPDLGPGIRAHGYGNAYQSESGTFRQQLPSDRYRVVITRGIEYDPVETTIDVPPGVTVPVEASLRRVVDTRGWISTDFHNHTTVSGDNLCGTDDRIINLAAEHVEFAPATEHNRIYDWKPHIDRLGLAAHVATVTGIELTGHGPHVNAFPLLAQFYRQDNGAPEWDPDPRITAIKLRRAPGDTASRWVQLNHPDVVHDFNDANGDKIPDGGFRHLESFIDAAEVYGEGLLAGKPVCDVPGPKGEKLGIPNRAFHWLQLLNAGRRVWTIATTDSHAVLNGVGGWRTYLPSSTDEPAQIKPQELIAHAKAGHSFVTTGPFLEVKTPEGHGPGETVASKEGIRLLVRVQCSAAMDIDRVVVLVNGRPSPECDFTRARQADLFRNGVVRFQHEIQVPLKEDAHLIVVAIGENSDLKTLYGQSYQARFKPIAYNNPLYVDIDGGGFKPNGDTLGYPFLAKQ